MADRKSQQKYIPPDFDPEVHGTVNRYHGRVASSEPVIRFEMPVHVWCLGCNSVIARGIRFNAKKTKAGMYHSSPIWEFSMKCRFCPQQFVIRTDPKAGDFTYVSGLKPRAGSEGVELVLGGTPDGFAGVEEKKRRAAAAERAEAGLKVAAGISKRRYGDPFAANSMARAARRAAEAKKKADAEAAAKAQPLKLLATADQTRAAARARMGLRGAKTPVDLMKMLKSRQKSHKR